MAKYRKVLKIVIVVVRYDIPLWIAYLLTNWLPDNRITIRLRGILWAPFIYKCGKNLTIAKYVQLRSAHRLTIGDNVYLATGVWLNAMGGLIIQDEVVMGPYVVISTGTHGWQNGSVRFGGTIMEPVIIGRGTLLAAHVVVRAGVKIGSGVLVAGNAAVCKDVPDNVVVGGVPAKIIRMREDTDGKVRHSRFE
jgi:acetyltransferase-like isoleucine patch superfamily enzyme